MILTHEQQIEANGVVTPGKMRRDAPAEDQVAAARQFIRECCEKTKTLRPRFDSYTYKHLVEEWSRRGGQEQYISNGAFIVAAMREGCAVKSGDHPRDPNATFNLKVPWLRGGIRYPEAGPAKSAVHA